MLSYLQRFRAKQLKIDRFFTNGLDEYGHEGSAIVSAIIKLAHTLEMDVVAEGVETDSQRSARTARLPDTVEIIYIVPLRIGFKRCHTHHNQGVIRFSMILASKLLRGTRHAHVFIGSKQPLIEKELP